MRSFRLIFRDSLDGSDVRVVIEAIDAKDAEKTARRKIHKGMRCVRIQAVGSR